MKKARFFATLLCAVLLVTLLPTTALAADGVAYLDADGTAKTRDGVTSVEQSDSVWNAGWYVVDHTLTTATRILIHGDVHLILADGCTLSATNGIEVNEGNSLTVYGQSGGSGGLTCSTTGTYDAAIGGNGSNLEHPVGSDAGKSPSTAALLPQPALMARASAAARTAAAVPSSSTAALLPQPPMREAAAARASAAASIRILS